MGLEWKNPHYLNSRRRMRLAFVALLLAVIAASIFWLLQRNPPEDVSAPAAKKLPSRSMPVPPSAPQPTGKPFQETQDSSAPGPLPVDDDSGSNPSEARQAADALFSAGNFQAALAAYRRLAPTDPLSRSCAGFCLARLGRWPEAISELQAAVEARSDHFAARKLLAQALYRQNELEPALVQAQAALSMLPDDELLDLQAKLQKEIRVQRNYDDARTANFVVLFDGYEHDEIKREVLDILKDAHAEIGKELDYFPEQPISVILYTAKDFSDVTSAPVWAGGMFGIIDGKIRLPVHGAEGREAVLRRVLYHEYVHALLHSMAPGTPLWLHEGLALYLSGDRAVNIGQGISLTLLVNGFPSEPRAAYVAYMESLQAVHDLLEEHGMPRMRRLLDKLGEGSDLETGFATAYGQPFSRWAKGWRPLRQAE